MNGTSPDTQLLENFKAIPRVCGNPGLLQQWLLQAKIAWIALILAAILIPLAVLPATDWTLKQIFPTTVKSAWGGLLKSSKVNPHLDTAKLLARILIWGAAAGGVLILFAREAALVAATQDKRKHREATDSDATVMTTPGSRTILTNRETKAQATTYGNPTLTGATGATLLTRSPLTMTGFLGPNNRYQVIEELGRGAMGVVYRAHDSVLGREVAIKELPAHLCLEQSRVERFRQEARTLAQISHPGIVNVFDLFDQGGQFYLVMELVLGGDLEGLLRRREALPTAEAARFGQQIADALASVHARGIVHRDLKPANILLSIDDRPKITDFGIARQEGSQGLTVEGSILGSPEYMSPEQASGRPVDARSDLYALGMILYRLFTGTLPFTGDLAGILAQQITSAPASPRQHNATLPEEIDRLILGLLVKDPAHRESDLDLVIRILNKYTIQQTGE